MGTGGRIGALALAMGSAVTLTSCSVPSVGVIAVSQVAGQLTAHVRICEGSGRVDGLTLYRSVGQKTSDVVEVEPPGGIEDGAAITLAAVDPETGAPLGRIPSSVDLSLYGWTRDDDESLSGPELPAGQWRDLDDDELMHPAEFETVVTRTTVEAWASTACDPVDH